MNLTKKRSDALSPEEKKAHMKAASRKYIASHKEVLKERQRIRRQNDPVYREKQNESTRIWRERKRVAGEYRKMYRGHHLRTKYGMSHGEYEALMVAQKSVCAICGLPDTRGWPLAVDHCHRTKANRGLLCGRCNVGIGLFKDSPALLQQAINYLSR